MVVQRARDRGGQLMVDRRASFEGREVGDGKQLGWQTSRVGIKKMVFESRVCSPIGVAS